MFSLLEKCVWFVFIIVGVLALINTVVKIIRSGKVDRRAAACIFIFCFGILWRGIIGADSHRYYLFLILPIIFLCGMFFQSLLRSSQRWARLTGGVVLAVVLAGGALKIFRSNPNYPWISVGINCIKNDPAHNKVKAVLYSTARANQFAYYSDALLLGNGADTLSSWKFVQEALKINHCSDFQIYIPFYIARQEADHYPGTKEFPEGQCRLICRVEHRSRRRDKIFLLYRFFPKAEIIKDSKGAFAENKLLSGIPRNGDFEAPQNKTPVPGWEVGGGGFNPHDPDSRVQISDAETISGDRSLIISTHGTAGISSGIFSPPFADGFLHWKIKGTPDTLYSIQLYNRSSDNIHSRRFLFRGIIMDHGTHDYLIPVRFMHDEKRINLAFLVTDGSAIIDDVTFCKKATAATAIRAHFCRSAQSKNGNIIFSEQRKLQKKTGMRMPRTLRLPFSLFPYACNE